MSAHPTAALRSRQVDAPTCNLSYLRKQLGRDGFGDQRMVTYLKGLIADHDFPAPLPTPRKKAIITEVCADSVWIRDAVEAWLDGFIPRSAIDARDEAALAAAAAAMDDRAARLGATA